MGAAHQAGVLYWALVFCVGFVLGAVRTVWLAPHFGDLAAVAIELPIILAISWIACGWVVARKWVPPRAASRLTMGAVALALLLIAETLLGAAVGSGAAAVWTSLATPAGALGFAGQIVYGLFPWVQLRAGGRREAADCYTPP